MGTRERLRRLELVGEVMTEKKYTKPTRFNLTLTFEQYKFLLERKRVARELDERIRYKDLVEQWGVSQYFMATAMYRGIKQYDERIKAERKDDSNRRPVPARRVERRNERCP